VHIAYQTVGSGPLDLVLVPGFVSHVEWLWEEAACARFLERLSSFSRLILFDKRGTGLSDRVNSVPTLEQRMDDVRAVLDAAGAQNAAIMGVSEGGPMSILFAATYPDRINSLVLCSTFAHAGAWVRTPEHLARMLDFVDKAWGTGKSLPRVAPSMAADEPFQRWWARLERLGASPGDAMALIEMNSQIDVRPVLSAVHVPTLILHRISDSFIHPRAARYVARHIPGAKFVGLPGTDHILWTQDADAVANEIEEFLTGVRHAPQRDRMLATVLFVDMVDSTKKAASLGDRRWSDQLKDYHRAVRHELERFSGREINKAGDAVLAAFDGPARAILCGYSIREVLRRQGMEIRTGLHTGECEVTVEGTQLDGIAVHIGARVAEAARPGEILVSRTVKDLVAGSGLRFQDRGTHRFKGLPARWHLFAAEQDDDRV
jgi:pimeloyl-ACP methyl ester carboxylesterase